MNFLGLHKKLEPIHIHWIYWLNDPDAYRKMRYVKHLPFASIALYSREETLKKLKSMHHSYFTPFLQDLIEIIEDADK